MNINFKFPLKFGPLGPFEMNDNTADSIKENLRLTLLTSKNERLMNEEIGSNFNKYLFSNDKEEMTSNIRKDIERIIETDFPFLSIIDIVVTTPDENPSLSNEQLYLSIKYTYNGIDGFKDSLSLIFNNN